MNNNRLRVSLALTLALSPLNLSAAGIVLRVPVTGSAAGSAAAAGNVLSALSAQLANPQALVTGDFAANYLPSSQSPVVEVTAPAEAVSAEEAVQREIRTAVPGPKEKPVTPKDQAAVTNAERKSRNLNAPEVGEEDFQKGLQNTTENAAEIKKSVGKDDKSAAGAERSADLGRRVFDGEAEKEGGVGEAGFSGAAGTEFSSRIRRNGLNARRDFTEDLAEYGLDARQIRQLKDILRTKHPGKQDEVYHGEDHSERVAETVAAILRGPVGRLKVKAKDGNGETMDFLSKEEKAFLLVAAALHDVDPSRTPGTPARVSGTFDYIDTDPQVRAFLESVGLNTAVGRGQLKTVVKFTDFNPAPGAMAQIQADAAAMAEQYFKEEAPKWSELGRLVAFGDQTGMYTHTVAYAEQAVKGLANEFKAINPEKAPTYEQVRTGTHNFLKPNMENPLFWLLPATMQANYKTVYDHFVKIAGPQAPATAAAAKPAEAKNLADSAAAAVDPFVSAFERYMYSMTTVSDRQRRPELRRQLYTVWSEGIKAFRNNKALEQGVFSFLFPQEAAQKQREESAVSPEFARFSSLIVKTAKEFGVTTAQIEAAIKSSPEVAALVRSSNDEAVVGVQIGYRVQSFRISEATKNYPDNAQGNFMRSVGDNIAVKTGKSVEELARANAFAYVKFSGRDVSQATSGRDPDVKTDKIFMVLFEDGKFQIRPYSGGISTGKNPDSDAMRNFKNWLVRGGIPEKDLVAP